MSSNHPLNPINFRFPLQLDENGKPDVAAQVRYMTSGIVDLNQAVAAMNAKVNGLHQIVQTVTSTSSGGSTPPAPTPFPFPGLGAVNDQTGNVAYTTLASDNGILLLLNDASPVAVTLNSALSTPYFLFITNFGAGTATLTPTSGLINGSASFSLLQNSLTLVVFDGTNWTATPLPVTVGATVTVTTAALTGGGTQGSQTFVNGLLISQVQAT